MNIKEKLLKLNTLSDTTIFVGLMMVTNLVNFAFNAYLGRVLNFTDFAGLTLINSLTYVFAIFLNALYTAVNHEAAFLRGKGINSKPFLWSTLKNSLKFVAAATTIFIFATPFLSTYFKTYDYSPFYIFSPLILFGTILAINRGILQGNIYLKLVGASVLLESLIKFSIAAIFINLNLSKLTYVAFPLSTILIAIITFVFVLRIRNYKSKVEVTNFPKKFYIATILIAASTNAFLVTDVLLAKHYLSAELAGQYALLALIGKIIYFFGSMLNTVAITLISEKEGAKQDSFKLFNLLLIGTSVLTLIGYFGVGIFGWYFIPILFGQKAQAILPFVNKYALSMALFTISNMILCFYLSKKSYNILILPAIATLILMFRIFLTHDGILDITNGIYFGSVLLMISLFIVHFFPDRKYIIRALHDLILLLTPLEEIVNLKAKNKVLIFNWRDVKHVNAGGAEVYVHEIAKRLVKNGDEVVLFCGSDGVEKPFEIIDGVKIIRRGGFYLLYPWTIIYYFLKFRGKFDVVIESVNGPFFMTPLYVTKKKFVIFYHVHLEFYKAFLPKYLAVIADFVERKLLPLIYRNIPIITISNSSKEELLKIGIKEQNINIVQPGIDLGLFKPGKKSPEPTVVYVGRLSKVKSIDVLINAFEKISKEIKNAKLVIGGGGDQEAVLKSLVEKLDLKNKVEILGRVTEQKKLELMQSAWVFVNPSFLEGWGITTIEANACGTAVVASKVPGLRDSVKNPHTGYLVEYGNVDKFANRISELLKDEVTRKQMEENSLDWAKEYDWDKKSDKFREIIW